MKWWTSSQHSRFELRAYAGKSQTVDAFHVAQIEMSSRPAHLKILQAEHSFSPPQSFLRLSIMGHEALDSMLRFQATPES